MEYSSIFVCLMGMGTVFFGLICLIALTYLMSAVVGRVSQMVGQKYNPGNFLLMHAMGPNVAGVIGSAIAAGVLISLYG